jgi:hypothetical protein
MTILINYIQHIMMKTETRFNDYYWIEALEVVGIITVIGSILYGL